MKVCTLNNIFYDSFFTFSLIYCFQQRDLQYINQNMQGNKLTLNIRKVVNKELRERIHIKTEKISQLKKSERQKGLEPQKQQKPIKLRHTSVLNRKAEKQEIIKSRQNNSAAKQKGKGQQKFPQIYNPSNSSAKYFDFKKYENKFKMTSTNSVIEKRKIDSEYSTQKPQKLEHRKTQLSSGHRSLKLREIIEPLKQMTKEKKIQLFKAIRSQFHQLINTTNNLSVRNQDISFRAYVEKGNNGILVRQIMKKRWWWHVEEDKEKANLIWTEWLDKSAISNLRNLTICDETISIEDYKIKKYEDAHDKSSAVKKIVDDMFYQRIEKKINLTSNTYFKSPKNKLSVAESLKNIESDRELDLRILTVDNNQTIHNHVQGCLNLHSKKLLFMNFHKFMTQKQWDPFQFIPLTFYIDDRNSPTVQQLMQKFDSEKLQNEQCKNIWICKPGENSNRGCGIKVVKSKQEILSEILSRLPESNKGNRSVIIQKYIEKCFLIHNRKFDIRCYILLTTANGILKGYWYKDGYIRTSSIEYNLNDTDNEMIHLTNDAVQKKGEDFGKHEDSNKLSFEYFKQYLKKSGISPQKFDEAYEQMKLIAYYLIGSVSTKIKRKQFTFEVFGLDFMLDQNLKPMLIEANSNPCLSNHGKILGKLIHQLVQNVFMTAIDPIFPPPVDLQKRKAEQLNKDYFSTNKFELIFTGKQRFNGEKNQKSKPTSIFENQILKEQE